MTVESNSRYLNSADKDLHNLMERDLQNMEDLLYLTKIAHANWNTHTLDSDGQLQKIVLIEPKVPENSTLFGKITGFFQNCFTRKKPQQTPSIKPISLRNAAEKIMTTIARVANNPERLFDTKKYLCLQSAKNFSLLADKMGQKESAEVVQKVSETILNTPVIKPSIQPVVEATDTQPESVISEELEVVPESPLREEHIVPESPEREEETDSHTLETLHFVPESPLREERIVPESPEREEEIDSHTLETLHFVPESPLREEHIVPESPEREEEIDSHTPEAESITPDLETSESVENDDSISPRFESQSKPLLQKAITRNVRRSWRFINRFGYHGRFDYTHFFYTRMRK